MTLLYIFVNFFNVWLDRKPLDSHICLCIQSVTILVLVEVYEENPASLHCVVEERRNLLMPFSDNCGVFFLLLQ